MSSFAEEKPDIRQPCFKMAFRESRKGGIATSTRVFPPKEGEETPKTSSRPPNRNLKDNPACGIIPGIIPHARDKPLTSLQVGHKGEHAINIFWSGRMNIEISSSLYQRNMREKNQFKEEISRFFGETETECKICRYYSSICISLCRF